MKDKKLIIAIDFDGTCVAHAYPDMGADIGAVPVLQKFVADGHQLILHTMRAKGSGLGEALAWFKERNIPLLGVNRNPTQHKWTTSPKVFAHVYIDDAALGAPLIRDSDVSHRPFIDWRWVEAMYDNGGFHQLFVEIVPMQTTDEGSDG